MPEERLKVIQLLWSERAKDMSFHLMESVDNILRNAASMGKGDPLRPGVAGDPVRGYRYHREDALEELTSAVTPSPLSLQHEWDQLLLWAF